MHLLDVGAGSESLLGTGEHQAALRRVRIVGRESRDQLLQNLAVESVERLRAIQRDERHRTALLDQDRTILAHLESPGTASIVRSAEAARRGRRASRR